MVILTNAHVVMHATTVMLRKEGHPRKARRALLVFSRDWLSHFSRLVLSLDSQFPGRLLACAPEVDLAIVAVDEPAFWAGTNALTLDALPQLQARL